MLPFVAIHFSRRFSHTNTKHACCLSCHYSDIKTSSAVSTEIVQCRLKDVNFIFFHKESKSYHAFILCNYQIGKIV